MYFGSKTLQCLKCFKLSFELTWLNYDVWKIKTSNKGTNCIVYPSLLALIKRQSPVCSIYSTKIPLLVTKSEESHYWRNPTYIVPVYSFPYKNTCFLQFKRQKLTWNGVNLFVKYYTGTVYVGFCHIIAIVKVLCRSLYWVQKFIFIVALTQPLA